MTRRRLAGLVRLFAIVFAIAVTHSLPGLASAAGPCPADERLVFAQGDESGLGGTGLAGDESGLGGTGISGDESGLGGTGIFGTITSLGSICVNGHRVLFDDDLRVVLADGSEDGSGALAAGQTIWLVASAAADGRLFTSEVWLLPESAPQSAVGVWLAQRIAEAGPLARLSIEGPVDAGPERDRIEVYGIAVEARDVEALRDAAESVTRLRVSGSLEDDGTLRVDRVTAPEPREEPAPSDFEREMLPHDGAGAAETPVPGSGTRVPPTSTRATSADGRDGVRVDGPEPVDAPKPEGRPERPERIDRPDSIRIERAEPQSRDSVR